MSVSPTCQCLSCPVHGEPQATPPVCRFYPSSSMTDSQWAVVSPAPAPRPPPPPALRSCRVWSFTLDVVKRTDKTAGFLVLPRRCVRDNTKPCPNTTKPWSTSP